MCVQGVEGRGIVSSLIAHLLQFLLPTTVCLFLTLKYSFQSSNRERMEERKVLRREGGKGLLEQADCGLWSADWILINGSSFRERRGR